MAEKGKSLKSIEEEQDRISDLPDTLIHHILSFLPSTKQAIQAGILSKRWRNQWTHLPVLKFNSIGKSRQNFLNFIEETLIPNYNSTITTFHLNYNRPVDPLFYKIIRFATTRHVEDLDLSFVGYQCFWPEVVFNNASLLQLRFRSFSFIPAGKVNWARLKVLKLFKSRFSNQAVENILSGSPLLQSFELIDCIYVNRPNNLVVASNSLKKLVLDSLCVDIIQISCLNLEELSITRLTKDYNSSDCFEMCCPKLKDMKIWGIITIMNVKLRNVPSSLCATLDITIYSYSTVSFVIDIMQQLQHIKDLKIGSRIIEMLTNFNVEGLSSLPMLLVKCLIFDRPYRYTHISKIARLLRNLPVLETLGVRLFLDDRCDDYEPKLDGLGENYWSPNAMGFDCLVSHLKKVKIYGIPLGYNKPVRMLNFIRFLLNNARVLENMTVVLRANRYQDYMFEASQELLGFARCCEHATVELISESS